MQLPSSPCAVVEVENSSLRSQVKHALKACGVMEVERSEGSRPPVAVVRTASDATKSQDAAAEVRIWTESRTRRVSNPFVSNNVRHVIGASAGIENDLMKAAFSQLESNKPLTLRDVIAADARKLSFRCKRSTEKSTILNALGEFLSDSGAGSDVRDTLITALDELFTNAIYNAPTRNGKHLYAELPRSQPVECEKPALITFASTPTTVAISVRDSYGSLSTSRLISALRRCYEQAQASHSDKAGGAGLGLFMMLQGVNRMVVNIHPGEYTEVILVRRLDQRRREFGMTAPTLNICTVDNAALPRRVRRWSIAGWPVVCRSDNEAQLAAIRDISESGCFLALDSGNLAVGSKIELTLASGRDVPPIAVHGIVRWRGHSQNHGCDGVGIEFTQSLPSWSKYVGGQVLQS